MKDLATTPSLFFYAKIIIYIQKRKEKQSVLTMGYGLMFIPITV